MRERIKELLLEIENLKNRMPAHSVKPEMIEELEDLEEELTRLLAKEKKVHNVD